MNKYERMTKLQQKISSLQVHNRNPVIEESEYRIQQLQARFNQIQKMEEEKYQNLQLEIQKIEDLIQKSSQ